MCNHDKVLGEIAKSLSDFAISQKDIAATNEELSTNVAVLTERVETLTGRGCEPGHMRIDKEVGVLENKIEKGIESKHTGYVTLIATAISSSIAAVLTFIMKGSHG